MSKNFQLFLKNSQLPVQPSVDESYLKHHLRWKKSFNVVNQSLQEKSKERFFLLDGPPYANGATHLGHALNKVWKDVVVKTQWLLGKSVQFQSGWDTQGLPLELLVEKEFSELKLSDPHAYQLKVKEKAKKLALRSVVKQRKDFQELGVLNDWKHPYLTLSKEMHDKTYETLSMLSQKDLLSYERMPVHYCPACASSLAEAELEYSLEKRLELYFKYSLGFLNNHPLYAVVWTTTPWTLFANQGLAFSNHLNYALFFNGHDYLLCEDNEKMHHLLKTLGYEWSKKFHPQDFPKKDLKTPLLNLGAFLVHGDFVTSGETGFVHVAGAHGMDDFQLVKSLDLDVLDVLDKNGRYDLVHLPDFHECKALNSQNKLVELLKEKQLFLHSSTNDFEFATCWRHKTKVYYYTTWQVFLNLKKLKHKVVKLLSMSDLSSEHKKRLSDMMLDRDHWCLSRQRVWGTALNLLVFNGKSRYLLKENAQYLSLMSKDKEKATEFLNQVYATYGRDNVSLVEDVLDVWFDSGNVANAYQNQGIPDLVVEGKDQFRGWFQSLFWLTAACHDDLAFKNVLVHGFVLDDHRKKFSKSSSNGMSTKQANRKYGPDVLRLWAVSQEELKDAVFSESKLQENKVFYQRFRLSLRFLESNLSSEYFSEEMLEKAVSHHDFLLFCVKSFEKMEETYVNHLSRYEFKQALHVLYQFCDQFLSQFMFDGLKNLLYLFPDHHEKKKHVLCVMEFLFKKLLKLSGVLCPYLSQEFYDSFKSKKMNHLPDSFFDFSFSSSLNTKFLDYKLDWSKVQNLKKEVGALTEPLQKNKTVKSTNQLKVLVHESFKVYDDDFSLCDLLNVSEVDFIQYDKVQLEMLHENVEYNKCPRCWKYSKFFTQLCTNCVDFDF